MTVKLATERKSLTHYTKGTPSPQLNWPSMGQLSWGAYRVAVHSMLAHLASVNPAVTHLLFGPKTSLSFTCELCIQDLFLRYVLLSRLATLGSSKEFAKIRSSSQAHVAWFA